ncbi:SusC/RagA family TonB-linked outer membrane protein [Chitinophaga deserti]|uniref:SusC/RagA family TonB-linked outer membrane protein n=1 Tax=Chitinophaga deserti TaxID=2164099 RepID=UPI000D6BE4A1|nr:SusC/RagA family TonB-linked outer membrane protein [Chitinophaga deserti]
MKDMNVRKTFIPVQQAAHGALRKGWRILMLPLALLAALPLGAQTVSLSVRKAPIDKVCKEIEKQTGFYFVYAKDLRDKEYPVSVDLKNEKVEKAIAKVFEGSPFSYEVIDKVVSVNTASKTAPKAIPAQDTLHIRGMVFGGGMALPGASVMSSKTKRMVLSDTKGNYELKGVVIGEEIIVSFIGFESKRIVVTEDRNVGFFLKPAANNLDNVVVKAYGTTSKRFNTGNIVSISGKEIENMPILNPLMALEGRVPGLTLTRTSADPSAPIKIEIRGRKNINPNIPSDPLIIVDNVPMTVLNLRTHQVQPYQSSNQLSMGLDQSGVTSGISPFFGMNPRDIESIEVLKDADATAIYGSRGSNGVILITTKKGKPGQTRVEVSLASGFNKAVSFPKVLNTKDYLQMRREAFANDGITPTATLGPGFAPDLMVWDTTRNTDWTKLLYGKTGFNTSGNVSVSGGSMYSTYRIGAGYSNSKSIETVSGGAKAANLSLNLGMTSVNQKFRLGFTGGFSQSSNDASRMYGNIRLAPNAPDIYKADGSLNYEGYALIKDFPFNGLGAFQKVLSNNLTGSLNAGYAITSALNFDLNIGYNKSISESRSTTPAGAQPPYNGTARGYLYLGETTNTNLNIEPSLRYSTVISQGKLDVMAGATYQANETWSLRTHGSEYTSDDLLGSISNAPKVAASELSGQYKYAGTYVNIGYNWAGKYVLSLNGNRDGSSRFGPGKQFGTFGSVAVAWLLTEEPWIRKNLPEWMSLLKLRGSYGSVGNDGAGDYMYLPQWNSMKEGSTQMLPYNGVLPLISQLHANNDYHWQSMIKSEAGIETRFFKERVGVDFALWRDRSDNQLVNFPTGFFTGFPSVYANSPANVKNYGWETSGYVQVLRKSNANWTLTFNLSQTKSKLVSYPHFDKSPYYFTKRIGHSLEEYYLFHFLGIDPATGDPVFEDANKDGKVGEVYDRPNWEGDKIIPNLSAPVLEGGVNSSLQVGRFTMSTSLVLKKKNAMSSISGEMGKMKNVLQWEFDNRWRKPGDIALVPRATTQNYATANEYSGSNAQFSMIHMLRVANLGMGYSLPDAWLKGTGIKQIAIRADANNLFLLSDYKGVDPDVSSYMPPMRTINFGINCSL